MSGALLETGVNTFVLSTDYSDFEFTFTEDHYVYKDEVYTFGFKNDASSTTFSYSGATNGTYAGGRFYSNYDFENDTDPADAGSDADAALIAVSLDQIPITYEINKAKLVSQNFSSSIGSLSTVNASFQFPITKTAGFKMTSEFLETSFASELTSSLAPAIWVVPD
jgi:hypothetical protein